MVQCKNYLKRIEKVLELDGDRIEPEYFKNKEKHEYKWEIPDDLPSQRIIYNDKKLRKYKEKKVKQRWDKVESNGRMKKIKSFKKRDLKYPIGRALSISREKEELIAQKTNSKIER